MKRFNVLSIAGVDPSGGAGIFADVKVFEAFGCYSMGVVAGLTAQNTQGVQNVQSISNEFLGQQLNSVLNDIKIDSIKIGMLSNENNVQVVSEFIDRVLQINPKCFIVLDPVMIATSGDRLLDAKAEKSILELAKKCHMITPNVMETSVLLSHIINSKVNVPTNFSSAFEQSFELQKYLDTTIVYCKGGHIDNNDKAVDIIIAKNSQTYLTTQYYRTQNTHGTGCSLSSAIAAVATYFLAQKQFADTKNYEETIVNICKIAKNYLSNAILNSSNLAVGIPNKGHGPLEHKIDKNSFFDYAKLLTNDIEEQIENMEFIKQLATGNLKKDKFAQYLIQDNYYLEVFTQIAQKALELLEAKPLVESRIKNPIKSFLKNSFTKDVAKEIQMHNRWLKDNGCLQNLNVSKVTLDYQNYLKSILQRGNFVETFVSLLPCVYLYWLIAKNLNDKSKDVDSKLNIYSEWIELYSDVSYQLVVDEMLALIQMVTKDISQEELSELLVIYRNCALFEFEFFNQI